MAATDCVNLLTELVAHRTINPGGDEHKLAQFLGEKLKAHAPDELVVQTVERPGETGAYVWARFGTPRTVINVHIDTVPVATGWTRDPFVATQVAAENSPRLYGLGTADTKGAIACVLTALADSKPTDVGILFSGDEELSSTVILAFLESEHAKGIERAIVCEPTGRALGVRHRGIRSYQLSTLGAGGHSSHADSTAKPLVIAARLAVELDALGENYLDVGPDDMRGLCLNVAKIDGGVAFNVIPERADLTFSVRPPPGFDATRFDGEIGTCIRRALRGCDQSIVTKLVLDRGPFASQNADTFIDLVGDAPTEHVSLDFWTEAALLSAAGIDAVVIGPGDIAVAHGPDEFVPISDLEWATAMFRRILASS